MVPQPSSPELVCLAVALPTRAKTTRSRANTRETATMAAAWLQFVAAETGTTSNCGLRLTILRALPLQVRPRHSDGMGQNGGVGWTRGPPGASPGFPGEASSAPELPT